MKVIKQVCDKHATLEDAQDAMAGLQVIPGFQLGYIDPKENRPVIFVACQDNGAALQPGQQRVDLTLPLDKAA